VNAVAPGYFVTNNTTALRADETRSRQIMERIPAGRWGTPDDLAGVAVFWPAAHPTTCTAPSCPWMAAGSRAEQVAQTRRVGQQAG